MNYAVYNIALDIHKTGTQVALSMIRGENKRKIVISLTENGRPYKISEGCSAYFAAKKPDGESIHNPCEIDFENNLIIYNVTSQTTAAMGETKCQIELIGSDKGLLFSPTFSLIVADKLYNQEPIVASSEEFNSLTKFLADLQQKLNNDEFKGDKGDKGDRGDRGPQGVQGDTGPAGKDADVSTLSPAIVCTEKGTAITVSDSSESAFEAFSIYGKSTQNGTPTPEAPIDIVSVGEDGKLCIDVNGKNLLRINKSEIGAAFVNNGITFILNADGTIKMNGTATATAFYNMDFENGEVKYPTQAKLTASASGLVSGVTMIVGYFNSENVAVDGVASVKVTTPSVEYELPKGTKKGRSYLMVLQGTTLQNVVIYPMIRLSMANSVFESAKDSQSLSVDLLNKLKGIPVTDSTLATYTDANGQMWCADEINLERGVYIQRVQKFIPTLNSGGQLYSLGTHARTSINFPDGISVNTPNGLCNIVGMVADYTADKVHFYAQNTQVWLFAPISELEEMSGKAIVNWYVNKGAVFYYILSTPVIKPLTSEEIAAYKVLKTNYPSTTILNDENAFMKVSYRADTKNFIKRMAGSTTQISSVNLSTSKWVGTASPYSQVVTIPGTTKNSKIDLNPTVTQLSDFHDKDTSFVVGNNNGTITVYCIGQKPTKDYTMQVTITEVVTNA